MFVVIYQWRIRQGREQQFIDAWSELTKIIQEKSGSLGSRLHRTNDGRFLAYAQWPSREAYEAADVKRIPEAKKYRNILLNCAKRVQQDTHLIVLEDQLVRPDASRNLSQDFSNRDLR